MMAIFLLVKAGHQCKLPALFHLRFMAYAIIKTGGKQYKVAAGDVIEVEKLSLDAGAETQFANATLFADDGAISIGAGSVVAEVVGQVKAPKVIAYKYKRRKGYHRTVGHRRQVTQLKIKSIA